MKPWPTTNVGWRDYYAKRWEIRPREPLLQLALFYQFMALEAGEVRADG